jgi:hypothetical protein
MVKIDLRGIAKVKAKGHVYYYAWRKGPRLRGEPGSPEFMASYNEAIENRRAPDKDRFRSLVALYKDSDVGDDAISITTGKSKHRRTALIPLYDDLRRVLASIPKRSTTILTNVRRRPWTTNGFGTAFDRAKVVAKMKGQELHFHDLRGTAVTKFYIAGIPERVIAEIMAWSEDEVAKIIRRYVGRTAATLALIQQINKKGT